jgi:hypothetical protein
MDPSPSRKAAPSEAFSENIPQDLLVGMPRKLGGYGEISVLRPQPRKGVHVDDPGKSPGILAKVDSGEIPQFQGSEGPYGTVLQGCQGVLVQKFRSFIGYTILPLSLVNQGVEKVFLLPLRADPHDSGYSWGFVSDKGYGILLSGEVFLRQGGLTIALPDAPGLLGEFFRIRYQGIRKNSLGRPFPSGLYENLPAGLQKSILRILQSFRRKKPHFRHGHLGLSQKRLTKVLIQGYSHGGGVRAAEGNSQALQKTGHLGLPAAPLSKALGYVEDEVRRIVLQSFLKGVILLESKGSTVILLNFSFQGKDGFFRVVFFEKVVRSGVKGFLKIVGYSYAQERHFLGGNADIHCMLFLLYKKKKIYLS